MVTAAGFESPDRHLTLAATRFIPRALARPLVSELKVGQIAPDFELSDDEGKQVKLSSLRGKRIVLFFYPEDDTPVCTQQACGFRDVFPEFLPEGVLVFGVSPDDGASHGAFKKKFGLQYGLLSDPGNVVAIRYGSFGEKLMYGKKVQGTIRSSIVIDAAGRIASVHRNVRSAGNGARMMQAIKESS